MPMSVKSRFRNLDGGAANVFSGTSVNCGWLKALIASHRNSSFFPSRTVNDLNKLRSKLLVPPVSSVLRPTVDAFGSDPTGACTQRTLDRATHASVSGFWKPVAQRWAAGRGSTTARLDRGALGFPISGRSFLTVSAFRSRSFKTVNGVPD